MSDSRFYQNGRFSGSILYVFRGDLFGGTHIKWFGASIVGRLGTHIYAFISLPICGFSKKLGYEWLGIGGLLSG